MKITINGISTLCLEPGQFTHTKADQLSNAIAQMENKGENVLSIANTLFESKEIIDCHNLLIHLLSVALNRNILQFENNNCKVDLAYIPQTKELDVFSADETVKIEIYSEKGSKLETTNCQKIDILRSLHSKQFNIKTNDATEHVVAKAISTNSDKACVRILEKKSLKIYSCEGNSQAYIITHDPVRT